MKTIRFIPLLAFFFASNQASAQNDKIAEMFKPFELKQHLGGNLDTRYLISKETGSSFFLYVYLPPTYSDTKNKYPMMLLNDAGIVMGIAQSTFDCLTLFGEIPEVIIVGISYFPVSNLEVFRNRFRDMTPTHVEGYDPSGKADKYIAFIKNELFPYIENNYRVDTTDRCFYGHSLGGLLGGYILVEQPTLFNRYIIGSPSFWWDNQELIKRFSNITLSNADRVSSVYTFIGSNEDGDLMITPWNEFNKLYSMKMNKTVKFKNQLFEGENHMSVSLAAFSTAVKFVYGE